jgi:hypothetical protein
MIGAINSFFSKARARGGRFGVCEVSDNMREGLSIARLDMLWAIYPTRRDALRALATESIGQKLYAARGAIAALACAIVVMAAGYVWWTDPFNLADRYRFAVMADIYQQAYELRTTSAPVAKWGELGDNTRGELEDIVDELRFSPQRLEPVKQRLLWMGKDYLMPMTAKNPQRLSDGEWNKLSEYMLFVQKRLHGDEPLVAGVPDEKLMIPLKSADIRSAKTAREQSRKRD